ncbi:hypothetical protein A9Q83_02760 [Alphaproteobacteria bacterium 46_93_T64]|nr:hypothetical protein A9Q83_02760 [Alphaproteobacteria bacterium 46_93_T64]
MQSPNKNNTGYSKLTKIMNTNVIVLYLFCLNVVVTPSLSAAEKIEGSSADFAHVALKGNAPTIVLKNGDRRHKLDSFKISSVDHPLQFSLKGEVHCNPDTVETRIVRAGRYLESVLTDVGTEQDRYWTDTAFANPDIEIEKFKGVNTLVVDPSVFNKTIYRFNAFEAFKRKLDRLKTEAIKLEFLKNDQKFRFQMPVTLEAICRKYSFNKLTKKTKYGERSSVLSNITVPIYVIYKADKKLTSRLVPKLKTGKVIATPKLPITTFFQVKETVVLDGPKNLRGSCPIKAPFDVEIKGRGDGNVILQVMDGRKIVYKSKAIKFTNGRASHSFEIPVGSKPAMPYQQFPHEMKWRVFTKSKTGRAFSTFTKKLPDAFYWQHSCIKPSQQQ